MSFGARRILAALAALAVLTLVALTGAAPASAAVARPEACTIQARSGTVHVAADFVSSGALTKIGYVWITSAHGVPFRLITVRAGWQRGPAGMLAGTRVWTITAPVPYYIGVHVVVQGTDGSRAGCVTRPTR